MPPAGIYNVAAGSIGVGKALTENGLAGKTVFIGHEFNLNSILLFEEGVMNFLIGHDVGLEAEQAIVCARQAVGRRPVSSPPVSRIRLYTKHCCN
jgi:LacI family transcriptional regulator